MRNKLSTFHGWLVEQYETIQDDPRTSLVRRDLRSLRSEKTVVLALLVQLVIAAFSSFLVVGLVSIYESGGSETQIAVTGNAAAEITNADKPGDNLDYDLYLTEDIAKNALENGEVDGVLVVTSGDTPRIKATIYVPEGKLKTTVVINQVSETLEQLEREIRLENKEKLDSKILSFPEESPKNTHFTFTYTKLLPLLVMLPVFLSGSIVVDMLAEERERGTFEVLRVTPLSIFDLVAAKTAVAAIFGVSQVALWLLLLMFNGFPIHGPIAILLLSLGLVLAATSIGLAIVVVVPERRYAQTVYSAVLLSAVVAIAALPQHPTNTVARLAIGGASLETYGMALAVFAGGAVIARGVAGLAEPVFRHFTA